MMLQYRSEPRRKPKSVNWCKCVLQNMETSLVNPQYKLWARMIITGQWSSHAHPPNIPLFTGESSRTTIESG